MAVISLERTVGQGTAGRIKQVGEGIHVVSGLFVAQGFPTADLESFAGQIVDEVSTPRNRQFMRQVDFRTQMDQLRTGGGALVVQTEAQGRRLERPRLLAAAQIFPFLGNELEGPHQEVSTVIRIAKGPEGREQAEKAVAEAAWLGVHREGSLGAVALVALDNDRARALFTERLEAPVLVAERPSNHVSRSDPETGEKVPVPMTIFGVNHLGEWVA